MRAPAIDAHVRLHDAETGTSTVVDDCRTDENGNFFIRGFVKGKYHLEADNYKTTSRVWDIAESKVFILFEKRSGVRLNLKPIKIDPNP